MDVAALGSLLQAVAPYATPLAMATGLALPSPASPNGRAQWATFFGRLARVAVALWQSPAGQQIEAQHLSPTLRAELDMLIQQGVAVQLAVASASVAAPAPVPAPIPAPAAPWEPAASAATASH